MPLTVVVEPDPGGHRFQSASFVLAGAARAGDVVLLTSAAATGTAEYRAFLGDADIDVRTPFTERHPSTATVLREVLALAATASPDTVVIMEGDDHLRRWWWLARGLRRRHGLRTIFFLTRYPARLSWNSDRRFWLVRIAKDLLVLAAMATGALQRAAGFAGRDETSAGFPVKRARDPMVCSAHARDRPRLRAELDLPADRFLVGISGGINARKNPPLVLEALEASGTGGLLVLSGPVGDDVRTWLAGLPAERRDSIVVDDGFLSSERLDSYIAAVDVVVLAMELEGPSGIQGKALAAGVPIVTAGSRTRERELRATHGGEAAEPTASSIGAALRRLADSPAAAPGTGMLAAPTGDEFAATILGPG